VRIASLAGRLVLIAEDHAIDVEKASSGRFGSAIQAVYRHWDEFTTWAKNADLAQGERFNEADLGAPAPEPRQIIAIGLNYSEHAAESGYSIPESEPPVFTKFASSITGPYGEIVLPHCGHTDWEVELVAVIGRRAYQVSTHDALAYVAGYTVGQDLSERRLQMAAEPAQFSLGKSFPGFAPIGPWLVTLDEFADPNDLELSCHIDGEQMQHGRTSQLIFSVPALIAKLSATMPLLPGDVVFTGTPAGVGLGRNPQRWLQPGEELTTRIEGIGEMRHRLVAAR